MSAAYFITGTDTDVGKTTIAAGLAACRAVGRFEHGGGQAGRLRLRCDAQGLAQCRCAGAAGGVLAAFDLCTGQSDGVRTGRSRRIWQRGRPAWR